MSDVDHRVRTAKTKYAIEFVGGPHDGLVTYWEELPWGTFHAEWHRLYNLGWESVHAPD
jgi:hypothetical protein